jgi:hypothetical protein
VILKFIQDKKIRLIIFSILYNVLSIPKKSIIKYEKICAGINIEIITLKLFKKLFSNIWTNEKSAKIIIK